MKLLNYLFFLILYFGYVIDQFIELIPGQNNFNFVLIRFRKEKQVEEEDTEPRHWFRFSHAIHNALEEH